MVILASVMGLDGAILVIIYLAIVVASIVGTAKIISKAGYSAWFVLLAFVPLVNLVMFFVFAFSDWPVHKELRHYRQGGYGPGFGGYPGSPWPNQPTPGYGSGGPQFRPGGWPPPPPGGSAPPPPSGWPSPSGGLAPPAPGGSPPPWPGAPRTEPGGSSPQWPGAPPPPAPGG